MSALGCDHSPGLGVYILFQPLSRVAKIGVFEVRVISRVFPSQRLLQPYIHVWHWPTTADFDHSVTDAKLGVEYLAKRAAETRQDNRKIVVVDHGRPEAWA